MKSTVCKCGCVRRDEQVATPEILQRKQVMAEFTPRVEAPPTHLYAPVTGNQMLTNNVLSCVTNLGEQYFGTVVVH